MPNVKTIELTGSKTEVRFGKNYPYFWVQNYGDGDVYMSLFPNVVPDADGVIRIPAGSGRSSGDVGQTDVLYFIGSGKVEITPQYNAVCPFFDRSGKGGEINGSTEVDLSGYVQNPDNKPILSDVSISLMNNTVYAIEYRFRRTNLDGISSVTSFAIPMATTYSAGAMKGTDKQKLDALLLPETLVSQTNNNVPTSKAVFDFVNQAVGAFADKSQLEGKADISYVDEQIAENQAMSTYTGQSGTIENTVEAPAYISELPPENLLEITAESQTINGVTFTVDKENGTITANGTAADTIYFLIGSVKIAPGKYYSVGCPVGGAFGKYLLFYKDGEYDTGNGVSVDIADEKTVSCQLRIQSGCVCNSLVFKPMLFKGTEYKGFIPYGGGKAKTTGRNLLEMNKNQTGNGITFTVDKEKGTVTVNGTATNNGAFYHFSIPTSKLPKGIYYLNGCPANGDLSTYFLSIRYNTPNGFRYVNDYGNGVVYDKDSDILLVMIQITGNATVDNVVFKPMLVKGSEPLPFEPYKSAEITVNSNMQLPAAGLKTFDGATHVFSNCDFTMDYFLSREQGAANAGLQNDINAIKMILDSITPEMLEKLKKL